MINRRKIILLAEEQRKHAVSLITNLPCNGTIEVLIQEKTKARNLSQNSLMWAGPLKDLEEQGYFSGRKYSSETWHVYLKMEFLPEELDLDITLEGYTKWDFTPKGERVLIGSTTQLTTRGMRDYMEQIYAFGASIGVTFREVLQPY